MTAKDIKIDRHKRKCTFLLSARLIDQVLSNQKLITVSNMQLFVRSLERTFVVSLDETATVNDLKNAIEDVEFIPSGNVTHVMCVFDNVM